MSSSPEKHAYGRRLEYNCSVYLLLFMEEFIRFHIKTETIPHQER
jgi:hypothetical protein